MYSAPEGSKPFSFTKAERLLKPDDFLKVKKSGKRYSTRSFTIFVLPNSLERRRLGLSVSSRVGGAVKRNRMKRLLREFFRLNKETFPASSDILISVKDLKAAAGYAEVASELGRVFSR